jgi:hypothetical protein
MPTNNPFGDDASLEKKRVDPFGNPTDLPVIEESAIRLEQAARKIRGLRSQMGAEGLTLPATREMIDEMGAGLEAAARALRSLQR